MTEQAGFLIAGVLYPIPDGFLLGDPVIIRELTGMAFPDFSEAMQEAQEDPSRGSDPVLMVGLVGVAVARKHPGWSRDRVVKYVQRVEFEQLSGQGGEEADEDGDPPTPAESGESSASSALSSSPSPDASVEPASPETPGESGSDTGSPESALVT